MTQKHPIEEFAFLVVDRLQNAGHRAYWVGGCVRDRLMSRPPKDYDVATSATPDEVLRIFPRGQKVGAAFGVILVRDGKRQVEVATFRADSAYSDGRHPDSIRFTNAEEDANRRDFTCNGLFFDPKTAQLHDFVGGQRDIKTQLLRAIGDPARRFAEDHLRMLRAIRFASRLGFVIEPATATALESHQQKISLISRERIGEEMRLMLEHPTRVAALTLLAQFPILLAEVLGFTPEQPGAAEWPTLSGLPENVGRAVALAAILRDAYAGDPAAAVPLLRSHLMLSNSETDELAWLCLKIRALEKWEDLSKAALKRIMADSRWKSLHTLYCADVENADQIFAFNERVESLDEEGVAPPPFITGDMLITLGAPPGRMFKIWLDQLYDRQLNGDLATLEDAVREAKGLIG